MLELLLQQLPSGLSAIEIAGSDEKFVQRVDYPFVSRTRAKQSPAPPQSSTPPFERRMKPQSVVVQLVQNIDELYDIYNESMKREATSRFIEQVRGFIGQNPGLALVGRKASREIMDYLTRTNDRPPDAFFKLCSFLLDANISANGRTYEWNSESKFTRTIHIKN